MYAQDAAAVVKKNENEKNAAKAANDAAKAKNDANAQDAEKVRTGCRQVCKNGQKLPIVAAHKMALFLE